MQNFIRTKSRTTLCLLLCSILTTLLNDFPEQLNFGENAQSAAFFVAIPFRLFTYATLFVSCAVVAFHLKGSIVRLITLATCWSIMGLVLFAWMWWILASDPNHYYTDTLKRFTPDTLADFAPGWTMAEVAVGKDVAAGYTWFKAIGLEALAILVTSTLTSLLLRYAGNSQRYILAYLAPIASMCVLLLYNLIFAPWSYVDSFDTFIGDALVGTMIYNSRLYLPFTLIYGGFTAPAIWVGMIAFVNVALIWWWASIEKE